jgi:hypothetical protein
MRQIATWLLVLVLTLAPRALLHADVRSKAIQEAAEFVFKKFGKEVAHESVESLAKQLQRQVAAHGDDVLQAVRRVGPKAMTTASAAGKEAGLAYRMMARHGEPAVEWIVKRPSAMRLVSRLGDDAAEVLVKHPGGIAEPLVEKFGAPAVNALKQVGPQNSRRLAMMLDDGSLTAIGRTPELLGVVGKYGDRAADFIWRNKGALAVSTALAAFLMDPKPFLDGAASLLDIAGETVVKPLVETPGRILSSVAQNVSWDLWLAGGGALLAAWWLYRSWRRRPAVHSTATPPQP